MNKNSEFKREKRMTELEENKNKCNNNKDPYGYGFVPTISHWTNIDEQRKEAEHLEDITNDNTNK